MFLPDGEDPDTYIRQHGKAAFEQEITRAESLINFMFRSLVDQVDTSSREGKAKLTTLAVPLIDKVPGGTLRLYLREQLGKTLGIMDENQLQQLISKQGAPEAKRQAQPEIKRTAMREVITLLIQNPNLAQLVPDLESVKDIPLPGLSLFLQLLENCRHNPHITTGQLLEYWRSDKNEKLLSRLAAWELPIDQDNQQDVFIDSLDKVLAQCIEKQVEALQTKERSVGLSVEEKRELGELVINRLV